MTNSRILLSDDADTISLKIRKAKTDPEPLPDTIQGLAGRPEAENLVDMYACFTDSTPEAVCQKFSGANFSTFKPALAEVMIEHLSPITKAYNELMKDVGHLDEIIHQGSLYARSIADRTIEEVYDIVGFLRTR